MEELKKINRKLFSDALQNRNNIDSMIKLYKEIGKEDEIIIVFDDNSTNKMDPSETRDILALLIADHLIKKYKKYNFTIKLWSNPYGISFHYRNPGSFWNRLAFVWTQHSIPKLNNIEVYDTNYIDEARDLSSMTGDDIIIMKW